jgi:DNA repair protein RadA/Sms
MVPGSLVLMAGEPGVGKSTLLLQIAGYVASTGAKVLYVSGEESVHQIKLRSDRLGISGQGIYMLSETDVDEVVQHLEQSKPALAVVDSVQTLYTQDIPSGQGSVAQVRECALRLMRWAKARAVPLFIAGHVTKDGTLAGPRVLEHMVDVVLYLEGENLSTYRILRGDKNRFGSTNEVGIFQMGGNGLEEVPDPSRVLLSQRQEEALGSAIVPVLEGSRPLLVEIQALTSPSMLAVPRRIANGVDYNRLLMLAAVLSRRAGLNLSNQDIIVSVVGGLKIREPATDAAIALAISSSLRNIPLNPGMAALGEVGLSGELRTAPQLQRRLNEASRLGFRQCLLPDSARDDASSAKGIEPIYAATLSHALRQCLPRGRASQEAGQLAGYVEEQRYGG